GGPQRTNVARAQLGIPGHRNDRGEAVVAHAPRPLGQPDDLALCPHGCAAGRRGIAYTERGISIAHAIPNRCGDLPQGAPYLECSMCLPKGDGLFNRTAPCADGIKTHCPRVGIAEYGLDPLPTAPPVLASSRGLSPPLVGATVILECRAE